MNISLVIQGPLHKNTIKNVQLNIHLFDDIIISTYKPSTSYDKYLLSLIPQTKSCTIIFSSSTKNNLIYNPANLINQLNSTLRGLKLAKHSTTIKIRSDEYYNLEVLQFLSLSQEKIISSNFIVRDFYSNNFAFSDHFIICNTNVFIESFMLLKANLKNNIRLYMSLKVSPETLIYSSFISYLSHSKELFFDISKKTSYNYAKRYVEIIDVSSLKPYCLMANNYDIESYDFKQLTGLLSKKNVGCFFYIYKVDDCYPSFLTSVLRKIIWRLGRKLLYRRVA